MTPTGGAGAGRGTPLTPTTDALDLAAAELRQGRLVAFPTETVYGLGANAEDADAVAEIYLLKGRPRRHPVIVHVATAAELDGWIRAVPPEAERLADAFWPGPLTMVLAAGPRAHAGVTGGQPTVGLRCPSHPVARELLTRFGGGVAAPSANRYGRISPTRAEHVAAEFAGAPRPPLILDGGPSPVGLESTIVDLSGPAPRLLRPGSISPEELARVLGAPLEAAGLDAPRAPGRVASHYAPATPAALVAPDALEGAVRAAHGRVGVLAFGRRLPAAARSCDLGDDPVHAGRRLYAALRELDDAGLDTILIERPPEGSAWLAIRDRVARAAGPADDPTSPPPLEDA